MKKLYTALYLTLFSATGVYAQLTQANHAPANGDTWSTYQCDTNGVNPGTAGTGKTWNYAGITVNNAMQVNYTTGNVSGLVNYPAANVSVTASNNENGYYASSASSLLYYGGKRIAQGNSFNLGYTSPAVMASYPMSMNTSSTVAVAGTVQVTVPQGSATGSFVGTNTVIADATGTMILPGTSQTFTNVMRTSFSQDITFTVSIPFVGSISGTMTELTYDYYQSGIKAPLFSISSFTVALPTPFPTTVEKIVTRNKDAVGTTTTISNPVSVKDIESGNGAIKIYPNPANQSVSLRTDSENWQTIEIYDLTGRLVESKELTAGKVTVDVSAYKEGLYIYTLKGTDLDRRHTGKITVAH
jgi:hypothetical protein